MKEGKKLVDLIYLDTNRSELDLTIDYQARIDTWLEWMDRMLGKLVDEDIYIEEQTEYFMINSFLKSFLIKRYKWILETTPDPELRYKYLLVFPPFNQRGNIKRFLLHFFQFKDDLNQQGIQFDFLNRSEREVRILWDIYKLIKTLKSIDVLKKHATGNDPFPSTFSTQQIVNLLDSLSGALELLVKICMKPDHYQETMNRFPVECFDPGSILERKETSAYLVNDMVLEKFDYRNYFFHIFFRPGLKANFRGEDLVFRFNYLDFEIIRQEFLIDWINRRLRGNTKKHEVFRKYRVGDKSFLDIIESTPEKELSLLKRLPKPVFDDLMAEVNEGVSEEEKALIDPMSEKTGEFAGYFSAYEKAKELAAKPVKVLRHFLMQIKPGLGPGTEKGGEIGDAQLKIENSAAARKYQIRMLKKNEIDFPYFCKTNSEFSKRLKQLQNKMSTDHYSIFNKTVRDYLSKLSESTPIKRRTPRHEWAVPFMIFEEGDEAAQLLILGAEAKSRQLSMSYGSNVEQSYEFKPYFVYGSLQENIRMGNPVETRKIRGKPFQIYSSTDPVVIDKMMQLLDHVVKN